MRHYLWRGSVVGLMKPTNIIAPYEEYNVLRVAFDIKNSTILSLSASVVEGDQGILEDKQRRFLSSCQLYCDSQTAFQAWGLWQFSQFFEGGICPAIYFF